MILVKEIELENVQPQTIMEFIDNGAVRVSKMSEMKATRDIIESGKNLITLESEIDIKITRVRNSIEIYKPKIYAIFLKTDKLNYSYKMKLSNWSSIILILLVVLNLFSISNTAISKNHDSYPIFIFALLIFLFLMHSETKIIDRNIKDAFQKVINQK